MLPWSVMPIAGWPSAHRRGHDVRPTRAAPSSIENSVWTWRWVKESVTDLALELLGCGSLDGSARSPFTGPVTGEAPRLRPSAGLALPAPPVTASVARTLDDPAIRADSERR